jgi:mono/diheme cytochrome c family protein
MRAHRVVWALVALVGSLALAGCGAAVGPVADGEGNLANGKQKFTEQCAACHRLADANAMGTVGPDLDEAFAYVIEQGFEESAIRDVVRGQIAWAVENPPTGEPGMPRDLVTGKDAIDVAAYVASVAGRPVVGPPDDGEEIMAGDQLFAANCAGCHTFAPARATGTVGPGLDGTRLSAQEIAAIVSEGRGAMPPFGGRLSEAQIQSVSEFVAGNGGR